MKPPKIMEYSLRCHRPDRYHLLPDQSANQHLACVKSLGQTGQPYSYRFHRCRCTFQYRRVQILVPMTLNHMCRCHLSYQKHPSHRGPPRSKSTDYETSYFRVRISAIPTPRTPAPILKSFTSKEESPLTSKSTDVYPTPAPCLPP